MRKLVLAGSLLVVCASVLSVLSTPDGGEVTAPSFQSERHLTRNPAESVALSELPLPAQARISTRLGVNVGLSVTTSEGACAAPAISSVEVHSPDAANIRVGTFRLRAERVKNLDGRVYLIVVKAVDAAGGVAFATATVVVPQKPGPASIASVNAQAAAAKSYADSHGGSPPPGFFVIGDGPVIGPLP